MSLDTRISLCIHTPFGAKTILSCSHFEESSPHISGSRSNRIFDLDQAYVRTI